MSNDATAVRLLVLSLPEVPDDLTPVLCEHLSLNKIDARIRIRRCPGILRDRLTPDEAKPLVDAIHEAGGYAVLLAADSVPDLSHPREIHHADCREEGLAVFDLKGDVAETVAWPDLELLSVGSIPATEMSHHELVETTTLHSAPGPKGEAIDLAVMRGAVAWIVAKNPFRAYRINHNEMNYEALGDRLGTSATANFRLFLDELIAHAREWLFLTPATRAFTNHGLYHQYLFDSAEDLREHTLFYLMIRQKMHEGDS